MDFATPLDQCELSTRLGNIAKGQGWVTLGDMAAANWRHIANFGRATQHEAETLLAKAVKKTPGKPRVGDGTPGPGRPKGLENKITRELKDMILGALDDAGGQKYLKDQAKENPAAFLTLIGKVLPLQVKASGEFNGTIEVTWKPAE